MIILFTITALVMLLYLLYPVWLALIIPRRAIQERETETIDVVSMILLCYNGRDYLHEKINFLLGELAGFRMHELIIIDDCSTDGTAGLLGEFRQLEHVKLLFNESHKGIPFSMNRGIDSAQFDYVIFCDQRQALSKNILKRVVEPLKNRKTGAVSGCISCLGKDKKSSFIRKHENFIKMRESRAGNLMGVYGPFYALKKQCYRTIPENIILDDLYLSLRILKSKQIELVRECEITDDNFSVLYDYKRARRYLAGLLQILKEKKAIQGLNYKQRTMLIWHKYLRLVIPGLLLCCYLSLASRAGAGIEYRIAFLLGTLVLLLAVLPARLSLHLRLKSLLLMNAFYLMAFLDILIHDLLLPRIKNLKQEP